MKAITKLAGTVILALAFSGCGSQENSDIKIYGGSKVSRGEWPSAVALVKEGTVDCTGTIVHPRLVITAAHCLEGVWSTNELSIYLGQGREGGRVNSQYDVVSYASSPRYARSASDWNDIAYLILDRPVDLRPDEIPSVLHRREEIHELIQVGQSARLVGFGGRNGGGYGVKYEVDAKITSFTRQEVSIGSNGKDSCQGDSGGPAYGQLRNGEWRVFGVVSRGGRCGTGGIWGRMSANICWVQEDSGIDLGIACR